MYIVVFIAGIIIGSIAAYLSFKISSWLNLRKLNKEYDVLFNEIYDMIGTKSIKFVNRYNNNITFSLTTSLHGPVNLMLMLDKRDLVLLKGDSVVFTTQFANRQLISNICDKLEITFIKKIMDCVIVMGSVVDSATIKRLNPHATFPPAFPVKEKNEEPNFTIDEILDRINQVGGIGNLSDVEREFLENYHNNQK